MTYILVNGVLKSSKTPVILPESKGFQYGMGLFETIRCQNGEPLYLPEHLKRLYNSAETLLIKLHAVEWENSIKQLLKKNNLLDCISKLKIICTNENTIITADRFIPVTSKSFSLSSALHPGSIYLSCHKTLCYWPYLIAKQQAEAKSFDDVLFIDDEGYILESSIANIIAFKGSKAFMPKSSHRLCGITEKIIFSILIKKDYSCSKENIKINDLVEYDGLILSNSLRGVIPINKINNISLNCLPDDFIESINKKLFKNS